jgi:anti-sigma regulatory factor (Ser/Thr protein kinase)
MGAGMAATDWGATPLGRVEDWPQSLRTTVNLCLSSRAPMMVVWGPRHVQLYNDALAPLMGPKHPAALGRPYAESFPEIWDEVMAPMLAGVYERGEPSYLEDSPVSFHRRVPNEEMFWTFSWSPLRDEQGRIVGALHPAVETTGRVLAERRLRLLRDLAASAGRSSTVQEACERAVAVLGAHPLDAPFSALYLLEDQPGLGVPVTVSLAATSGVGDVAAVFAAEVDLTQATYTAWPLAAAAASGRVEVAARLGVDPSWLLDWPWPEPPATGVVLPLSYPGRERPLALLAIGLNPRRPMDDPQLSFLQLLAGQLATALSTAALHEQQYRVAVTLQRSLLPDTSQASSALDVAARYLPGATDSQVGGDWYDVVPLGAGRTALIVGDVMGRGVHAAAVMGQLRAAARAYAQLDLPPGRVLELLDALVNHISESRDVGQIVTCIYAVHDSGDATLTLANAGHPPAVLFSAEGCSLWHGPVGPPLGAGEGRYTAGSGPFPGGAGLLLYSDGLIEQRNRDIDIGIEHLLDTILSTGTEDLERLADAALAIQGGAQHDDVALLAVRVPQADLPAAALVDLRGDARAARTARRATTAALSNWAVADDLIDSAVLLAGELVNNAITHTGRPRQLRLRRLVDRLVIEVSDADPRPPRRLAPDTTAEGGRGLMILAAIASVWGVRFDGSGKVVWCEVPLDAA